MMPPMQTLRAPLALVIALGAALPARAEQGGALYAQAKTEPDLSPGRLLRPAGKTVAILLISGGEVGVPSSEIYGNARQVVEAHTALNVAPLDVIGITEREAAIRDCAGNAKCFARRVRDTASNVNLLLTVSVDRLDDGYLLGFRLVDVATEQDLGAAGDEIPTGMSMLGAMEQQLPTVFPASVWDQIGALEIDSQPTAAEVTAAGRSCVSPCQLTRLTPGSYEVTIKKSGFLQWQGNAVVNPRETSRIEVKLEEPAGGITSSPWFWVALGAVAVGGGVAAFFALRPSEKVVNLCIADDIAMCEQQ